MLAVIVSITLVKQMFVVIAKAVPTGVLEERSFDLYPL